MVRRSTVREPELCAECASESLQVGFGLFGAYAECHACGFYEDRRPAEEQYNVSRTDGLTQTAERGKSAA